MQLPPHTLRNFKRIAVGADHAAAPAKDELVAHLKEKGWIVKDFTVIVDGKADYPIAGARVARAVAKQQYPCGLLMCGTGLGMTYIANRFRGVRAALCLDTEYARLARDHNNANILVLPGRQKAYAPLADILDVFIETHFSEDERHQKRIALVDDPDSIPEMDGQHD